jgi:tetratricopeptide (TPR) repeat protein
MRLGRGETPAAVEYALKALAVDRTSRGARVLLGNLALRGRRPADAAAEFRRAVAVSPSPEACVGQALALAAMGRTAEAARQLEDVLQRYPDSAEAHLLLASLRDFEGSPEGAVRAAREGLRVSPAASRLHVLLARGLLRANETGEAVCHYRIALRFDPGSASALVGLAWVLAAHEEGRSRNGAEAVLLAQRACALTEPPKPQALRALAAAYAEVGEYARAEQVAQRLLDQLAGPENVRLIDQLKQDVTQYREGKPLREKAPSMLKHVQETK